MFSKIFRSSFVTSMLVLIMSFCMIVAVLFEYFEMQIFKELENEAEYISYFVKTDGESYINNFTGNDKRITLVAEDGTVSYVSRDASWEMCETLLDYIINGRDLANVQMHILGIIREMQEFYWE